MAKRTEYRPLPTPTDVEVVSNVPLPAPIKRMSPLPLAKMKVGDSFFVAAPVGMAKRFVNRLRNTTGHYRRQHDPDFFVALRIENGGVRVWRIEKPEDYDWRRERADKGNQAKKESKNAED